ncbi:DoxX family protein [Natrinema sp. 1APR25-10V2]|uniref:DoxX family protein n=1 Tax=Natrinema sp. 1APR25-10V2 TaxID=2951081 RepID=UPI00287698E1|nr:DoxX family protein [Natrinema sp. 1APR25-10V2]MDS0475229.1 DoxX family protein [Natrinema sp. 1APR25-10V2]
MAFEATGAGEALLAGRILFAAVLGFLAVGNLQDVDETVAYAASKGAPVPRLTVPLASLALVAGAVSILLGAFPLLGSLAVVGFLVGVTPVMHDFWSQEGMDRQNEQIHFLKNVGLAGGALVFAALATTTWPYAVGLTI